MTNRERFQTALEDAYVYLFANDPDYAYSASRLTPAQLAEKMTISMLANTANHEGSGFRRACKAVGIKHTRTAIRAFLAEDNNV
jgi:hypothetical protein